MFKNISESTRIFIFKTIKAIADCLISVFIPIYILKATQNAMLAVLYLVIWSLAVVVLNLALKKILQKHSILCVILHVVPVILSQALLNLTNINLAIVVLIGVLMGSAQTLYSVPQNLIFAYTDRKTNVRKLEISTNLGKFIFIIISGFLLAKVESSFLVLSIIATILYIISFIPLTTLSKILKNKITESYSLTISTQKLPIHFKIFHVGMGAYQGFVSHFLPVFLFMNNLSFEAVAIVMALVELVKLFMNYIAKFIYFKDKFRIIQTITYMVFVVSIVVLLTNKVPAVLFIISCVLEAIFPLFFVPMFGSFCNYVKKENMVAEEMLIRDVDIFLPRPLIYCSFCIFPIEFISFIIAAGISSLMYVGLIENKKFEQINKK